MIIKKKELKTSLTVNKEQLLQISRSAHQLTHEQCWTKYTTLFSLEQEIFELIPNF